VTLLEDAVEIIDNRNGSTLTRWYSMKTWYVILDEDGPFLTDDPAETDEIVFRGSQEDVEIALGLILIAGSVNY